MRKGVRACEGVEGRDVMLNLGKVVGEVGI